MPTISGSAERTLSADLFVSLDGYAKGARSPAYFGMLGPQLEGWIERELRAPQTVVMGRMTYEALAGYDDGTSPLSAMPKVVVSRTLSEPSWGETRVKPPVDCLDDVTDAGRAVRSLSAPGRASR